MESLTKKHSKNMAYQAGILQGKAYRVLQNHLSDVLSDFDISIPEWKLLGQLYDYGQLKAKSLAEILDVDPPLITALVNGLLQKKLVKKIADSKDKRVTYIAPTQKTISLIPQTEEAVRTMMKELLNGITSEELNTYIKVLTIIVKQGTVLKIKNQYLLG